MTVYCSGSQPFLFKVYFFGGHEGHKVKFVYIPLLSAPLQQLGVWGSVVSSPMGSGVEPQPTTHFRAFYGKK